jgi:O-antigen ligase
MISTVARSPAAARSDQGTGALTAVMLTVAWGGFSFGAVYQWAYWPLAFGAAGCGLLCVATGRRALRASRRLLIALASIAAAMIVQLIPLPARMLDQISPRATGLIAEIDVAFAAGARAAHPLSIAPDATLLALTLFVAFVILLIGLLRLITADAARRLAVSVAALGFLMALVGIVQKPLFAGKIYGIWEPMMDGSVFGPFVNKNHFAGWMLMALPVAIGLLCAGIAESLAAVRPGWRDRILWAASPSANRSVLLAAGIAVMTLSLMMTMSRSGMIALVIALTVMAANACRRSALRMQAFGLAAVVLLLVTAAGWVGIDTIASRFASGDTGTVSGRLPIWKDSLAIARDFPLAGTGLNTFGIATLLYPTSLSHTHLREAHNDYLQILVEGGLLVAVPVAVALALFVVTVARRLRSSAGSSRWIRLGAATSLIAIALQSLVEFSLQMPGNAALFTVVSALALHHGDES